MCGFRVLSFLFFSPPLKKVFLHCRVSPPFPVTIRPFAPPAPPKVDLGGVGHLTHFRTSEAPNHQIRFETVAHPNVFLGIDGGADKMAGGGGGAGCHFKVHIMDTGVCVSLGCAGTGRGIQQIAGRVGHPQVSSRLSPRCIAPFH
jgi:hypothetical protein